MVMALCERFPVFLLLVLIAGWPLGAQAAVVNTVTVTVSQPGADEELTGQATTDVTVAEAAPALELSLSAELSSDGDEDGLADADDVITYSYSVRNSGNVTIGGVAIRESHDGAAELPAPIFVQWIEQAGSPDTEFGAVAITLAPGAEAQFQVAYTVAQADLNAAGGASAPDNDIDNVATAIGRYNSASGPAELESASAAAEIPLDIIRSIAVTNVAEPASGAAPGQIITYTYTIANDGNVPVSGITVSQDHNGSGEFAAPDPDSAILADNNVPDDSSNDNKGDNQWDLLGPGDVLTLTATYAVTQEDIDNLQ